MFTTPSIGRKLTPSELSALLSSSKGRQRPPGVLCGTCGTCGRIFVANEIEYVTRQPRQGCQDDIIGHRHPDGSFHSTAGSPLAVLGQGDYARGIDAVPGPKLSFTFLAWRFTVAFLIAAVFLMLCILLIH